MSRFFVGMTGASGTLYAERLVQALVQHGHQVDLALSPAAVKVLNYERGFKAGDNAESLASCLADWLGKEVAKDIRSFGCDAVEAPASSGTAGIAAVILCPCSMGTLARVAAGYSSNLVERAADVALKERRELVLVPRETPLSEIHLENMLRLRRMGAVILPAMPGFYHKPQTVFELVDHVVGKILDTLKLEHSVGARWGAQKRPDGMQDPGA
ncbi:MAG: 4-hydroxy-3-polyprenylbenzoate decarboxylase [Planctomycetota bacterium]|jgi:4-hydroxy-3-polyprenylbenzoate decarboxylase